MTITEVLGMEYQDFLEFCSNWGKTYLDELSPSDFVAFRVQYGRDRDYIEKIKATLKKGRVSSNQVDSQDEVLTSNSGTLDSFDEKLFPQQESEASVRFSDDDADLLTAYIKHSDTNEQEFITKENKEENIDSSVVSELAEKYDVSVPIFVLLGIQMDSSFERISIDSLPVGIKIRRLLKNVGLVSVAAALNSSISKIFHGENVKDYIVEDALCSLKDLVSQDRYCGKYFMMQSQYPLSTVFDLPDSIGYEEISIESVGFNIRFYNALRTNKIYSLQELLSLTIDEMLGWKNLGSTSIEESVERLYNYLCNENKKIIKVKGRVEIETKRAMMVRMFELVKSGQESDLSFLSHDELETFNTIKGAIDDCGYEFYEAVSKVPQYFRCLSQSLATFSKEQAVIAQKVKGIDDIALMLPDQLMFAYAKLMSYAYHLRHVNALGQFWEAISDDCLVRDLFEEIHSRLKTVSELSSICKFLEWLKNLSIERVLEDIFLKDALEGSHNKVDESYKDKYLSAIELRAAGETLESIGAKLGMTRERARQIERRFTNVFADRYKNNIYDAFAIIHALRGGDKVLTYDEVCGMIGDRFTKLLWLLLSKGLLDNDVYRYSKRYNSVIFTSNVEGELGKMEAAYDDMPEYFLAEQYNSIVDSAIAKYELHCELFEMFIEEHFQLNGIVYSKFAPTVIFMVSYVLKERFASGYKIAVSDEVSRFREYMVGFFGDKGKKTTRAIDAVVGQIGVLIGRGKYVHPDYLNVEQWIINEINAYIEANVKSVIPYSEIYDALKDIFSGTIITNRYVLQGALKKYGSPFTMAKDYVTKEKGKSLTDEFEDFAKEIGEFSKEDFFAAFPALGEANLVMLIGRCKNVFNIDNGLYMHSSQLKIKDADYSAIREYLLQSCSENPVNSRILFDEFSYRFIDFMDRNDIGNHNKLFGVLYYMFEGEFNFSRPYIAKIGTGQITNKSALIGFIGDVDSISIEEAVDICSSNGIHVYSVWNVIHMLSPEYLRVDKDKLQKFSVTGIDDEVIYKVVGIINEGLASKGYLSSANIDNFLFYPKINISWTPYLVEAIADIVGERICCINIAMANYELCTHIFVSPKYKGMDYQQFLLTLLDDAFSRGSFTNKQEMREWLYDRGLITTTGLPKFLEETKFYYMDGNGRLCRVTAQED